MGMLHDEPVRRDDGDGDGAWTGQKRRRKYLPQSSSSHAPTATAQDPISHALLGAGEAAKDHQGPISGMANGQEQDHTLLPIMDSGEEEETQELFGPQVILSEEDQASYAQILLPNIPPPIKMTPRMSWMDNIKVQVRQGRYRIAYYKAMNAESGCKLKDENAYSDDEIAHQDYFKHLEDDDCFEWFFHTDDSWIPDLNDYQRIVLRNFMPGSIEPEYSDVDDYRERYHTYEMDALFVKYYGEISKKLKWIEEFLHLDARSAELKPHDMATYAQKKMEIAERMHMA